VLAVACPLCGRRNEFPEFDSVTVFLCRGCGEPTKVEEPVQ